MNIPNIPRSTSVNCTVRKMVVDVRTSTNRSRCVFYQHIFVCHDDCSSPSQQRNDYLTVTDSASKLLTFHIPLAGLELIVRLSSLT